MGLYEIKRKFEGCNITCSVIATVAGFRVAIHKVFSWSPRLTRFNTAKTSATVLNC